MARSRCPHQKDISQIDGGKGKMRCPTINREVQIKGRRCENKSCSCKR